MSWASPWAFTLFLVLAALLAVIWWWRERRQASLKFSGVKNLQKLNGGWRAKFSPLPLILKIVALVLMILALARPQESDTKVKRNVEGIDIVICFDISDSMLIEDMRPNRLEVAKEMAKKFINKRVSDRIGLVLFSGEAFTKVPPTLDYKVLLAAIDDIKIERVIKMGTAIGVALANSTARLKDSTAKSRVIILMTDGENNAGTIDPETALDVAKGYGLRIYTIGVGVDGMAQLPVYTRDMFGNQRKTYQPMHSKVNDELLGLMATETGGKYFRASTAGALDRVFTDIDRMEKVKIEVNKFTRYTELFQNYLWWALMFYIVAVFLARVVLRRAP